MINWTEKFYKEALKNPKKAEEIYNCNKPNSLLKFCNGSYSGDESNNYIKCIENNRLWFSSPSSFNDPFDCAFNVGNPMLNILDDLEKQGVDLKEGYCNYLKEEKNAEKASKAMQHVENNFKKLSKEIFICCFSGKKNLMSLLMWSHYANSHKGFCVEYDFNEIERNVTNILPVHYNNNLKSLSNMYLGEMSEIEFVKNSILTKSIEWKYEKEWRVYVTDINKSGLSGFIQPFIKPINIYLGCKTSKKLEDDLLNVCKKKNISLYKMKMKPDSFDLTNQKIYSAQ